MSIKRPLIIALLFLVSLVASPVATAQMGGGKMGGGMMSPEMKKKHHEAMGDRLEMMKELMDIVKNLNHTPSAAQKKRLTEMMERLDEIIKMHEEMGGMCGM
jgi:Spy/CpxP family protein refolding chaperone